MGQRVPGYEALQSISPNEILFSTRIPVSTKSVTIDSGGIDGGNTNTYDIRAGWPLGMITSTGQYVPCKRSRVSSVFSTTSSASGIASVTLYNADAFKIGDVITIGADTGITILDVDYTTNELTLDTDLVWDTDEVVVAQDGSQICRGFLFEFARLRNRDNTAAADHIAAMLTVGCLKQESLYGDIDSIVAAIPAMVVANTHFLTGVEIWKAGVQVA